MLVLVMAWDARSPGGKADGYSQKGRKWAKSLVPMGDRGGRWIGHWPGEATGPTGFDQAKDLFSHMVALQYDIWNAFLNGF